MLWTKEIIPGNTAPQSRGHPSVRGTPMHLSQESLILGPSCLLQQVLGTTFQNLQGHLSQVQTLLLDLLGSRFRRAPSSPENSQTQNNIVTQGPRTEEPVWSLVPWHNYVLFSLQALTQSQAWNVRGVRCLHERGRSQSHSKLQTPPRATGRKGAYPGIQFRAPLGVGKS